MYHQGRLLLLVDRRAAARWTGGLPRGRNRGSAMLRQEFGFIVTDTELSEELQQEVGQAGAIAPVALTLADAITVQVGIGQWRPAQPPTELRQALEEAAAQRRVVTRRHLAYISSHVAAGTRMMHQ